MWVAKTPKVLVIELSSVSFRGLALLSDKIYDSNYNQGYDSSYNNYIHSSYKNHTDLKAT